MRFLKNPLAAVESWFQRRTAVLSHPRAPFLAACIVPVLFGLLSVCLGQDDNWDLKNYHWYNPHALLHGRIAIDMAPGQWQSYFNPLLDLPYYLLNAWLPAPAVGFVMGWLHGLNFILLLAIARRVLGHAAGNARLPLLLAAVGMCGAGFLSELGNSMGDNMTALLTLSSVYLVLRGWAHLPAWSAQAVKTVLLAGFVMGLGAGLKPTNVTYAAALCVALLALPASFGVRLGAAFASGCAIVAGMLATAGWWWLAMWERFGNPLFPQFNNVFRSPLAQQFGIIDNFHMPHGVLEALFWPFVFTRNFLRVSEIILKQAILPVLYGLAIVLALTWLAERFGGKRVQAPLSARARFLLVFGLVAYLAWMKVFGIYRYLVPLELLAPLMAWILVGRIIQRPVAARLAGWLLAATTVVVFPFMTWGHAGWTATGFSAQLPPFARPASTIVFTAHAHPPMGWLANFFPADVRVVALGSGFPESPAYLERIQAAIAERQGPHYVMLALAKNEKESSLRRKQELVDMLGLTADANSCARLDRLLQRVRFQVQVKPLEHEGRQCTIELQARYAVDLAARDRTVMQAARDNLGRYGLAIDEAGCQAYPAAVGDESYPFRLCPVTATGRASAPAP